MPTDVFMVNRYQDLFIQQELTHGTSANNILHGRATFSTRGLNELRAAVIRLLERSTWPYLKLGDDYREWVRTRRWQGTLNAVAPSSPQLSLKRPWSVFVYQINDQSILDVMIHHAWADGHSFQLFWSDLMAHLDEKNALSPSDSFSGKAIESVHSADLGTIKTTQDVGLGTVQRLTVSIPAYRKQRLEQIAKAQGISLSSVLIGTLQHVLDTCERQLEIPLQLGMALRNRTGRQAKSDFLSRVNFLPLAHSEKGDWSDVERRVRHLFRNQAFPLLDWMSQENRHTAFNVLFSYQKESYHPVDADQQETLAFLPTHIDENVLGVHVLEFGQKHLDISFDVRTDIADTSFWRSVIVRFLMALDAFPSLQLPPFNPAITAAEYKPFPFWSRFDEAISEKVALVVDGKSTTFGELRKCLAEPQEPEASAVYLEPNRSKENIVDILKSWKKGRPVSFVKSSGTAYPEGDWLYFAETSGSTGKPKPLLIGKAGIESLLPSWESQLQIDEDAVHLSLADQRFDVFFGDVFRSLMLGGTLILASEEDRLSPNRISHMIIEYGVTHLESTPSFLNLVIPALTRPSALRCLISGSEAMTPRLYSQLDAIRVSGVRVFNSFGLTEVSIDSALTELVQYEDTFPLGFPLGDQRFDIRNQHGDAVPFGVWGELQITGTCVAHSLIDDPCFQFDEKGRKLFRTGDRAMLHPKHGLIIKGRLNADFIKVNGRRLPAKAMENALLGDVRVNRALLIEKGGGAILLHESRLNEHEIRELLQPNFSRHHMPDLIHRHTEWPLNQNGKLDVKALRDSVHLPTSSSQQWAAGESHMEQTLQALLREFEKPYQGGDDLLIYTGWNSIDFLSFCNQWNLKGYVISPRKWLEHPTLNHLLTNSVRNDSQPSKLQMNEVDQADWDEFLDVLNQE